MGRFTKGNEIEIFELLAELDDESGFVDACWTGKAADRLGF